MHRTKKSWFPVFLSCLLLVALLPNTAFAADTNVTTIAGLQAAIGAAPTNGTETVINITQDITFTAVDDRTTIPDGTNIKIVGNGGNLATSIARAFIVGDEEGDGATLSLQDITFSSTNTMMIQAQANSVVNMSGVTLSTTGRNATQGGFVFWGNNCVLNVYSGTFINSNESEDRRGIFGFPPSGDPDEMCYINFIPIGDIYVSGIIEGLITTNIIPQSNYSITEVTNGGADITDAVNSAGASYALSPANPLSISVTAGSGEPAVGTNVTTIAELQAAAAAAPTDGTETVINITQNLIISSTADRITIPTGSNVRIIGNGNSLVTNTAQGFIIGSSNGAGATLTLQNIEYSGSNSASTRLFIYSNSTVNLIGMEFTTAYNNPTTGGILFQQANSTINIFSGTYVNTLDAQNEYGDEQFRGLIGAQTAATGCVVNFIPTGDINVSGIITDHIAVNIVPQSGYDITAVTSGGTDITAAVNSAGASYALTYANPLSISVTAGSGPVDPPAATYTVSATVADTAKYIGETFAVNVAVTGSESTATLAAVDAVLSYDKDLVTPISAALGSSLTSGSALYYTDGNNGVTTDGTGKVIAWGVSSAVGSSGFTVATYTFEAKAVGNAEFSIASGAKVGLSGSSSDIAATSGTAVTVAISDTPASTELISGDTFKGAPTGYQVLKYTANALPESGKAFFYDDDATPLFYAGQNSNNKYVFLGFISSSVTNDTIASVTEEDGIYVAIKHDGDVNGNSVINAIDALICYDLENGNTVYLSDAVFTALAALARLEADVNNDGVIDARDSRAIMYRALNIADPELTP